MFFPIDKSKIGVFKENNPVMQFLMVKSLIAGDEPIHHMNTLLSIMFPHMFPYTIQFLMLISLYRFHMKIRILHMIPHENQDVAYDFP